MALPVWAERRRKIALRHKDYRTLTVGAVWSVSVSERDGHVDIELPQYGDDPDVLPTKLRYDIATGSLREAVVVKPWPEEAVYDDGTVWSVADQNDIKARYKIQLAVVHEEIKTTREFLNRLSPGGDFDDMEGAWLTGQPVILAAEALKLSNLGMKWGADAEERRGLR